MFRQDLVMRNVSWLDNVWPRVLTDAATGILTPMVNGRDIREHTGAR